ncbi:hypothetical protein Fmac_012038 [Flemingia macrophylla]|uniref:DNA-directed RNA polymerase III subunit RPC3 n=1 Tax=Flemingia macrophylla TaxID=520843 RepID=A0ABD1MQ05_9FABA
MLDLNNLDASKVIFSDIQEKIFGIENAMSTFLLYVNLGQLCCSQRMIVDDSYSIGKIDIYFPHDLKKIIERARNEEVESIVLKRYGRDAYRMFMLLSRDGDFRDTDQKKPVTGAGMQNTSIMMWKVNKPLLWEYVLDEMYHAALNLNQRMAFEQEKDEELLCKPQCGKGKKEKDVVADILTSLSKKPVTLSWEDNNCSTMEISGLEIGWGQVMDESSCLD